VKFEPGVPESFNVLTNELKSLGLNIEMIEKEDKTKKSLPSGGPTND
jgi:hypothetical protein